MKILAIDTSCDETACAVTENTTILSNVVWSQASLHTKWGGILPSLAKREHQARIDWVVNRAITNSKLPARNASSIADAGGQMLNIDAIAVTVGPGLAIALEVGIKKAKELSVKFKKPLVLVNHIEGHILSPLVLPRTEISNFQFPISNKPQRSKLLNHKSSFLNQVRFPAIGIVTSGKHTELIYIEKIGKYKILAQTVDDALGEALDKAARMLGLGYPGGAILEKLAKSGDPLKYNLPVPLSGQESRMIFSYSGLKTAMFRKVEELKNKKGGLTKTGICDLAASFQEVAFEHFIRVLKYSVDKKMFGEASQILAGGGVMANTLLRKKIITVAKTYGLEVYYPYTKRLYGDNAAMIGIVAHFRAKRKEFVKDISLIDRLPNLKIDNQLI